MRFERRESCSRFLASPRGLDATLIDASTRRSIAVEYSSLAPVRRDARFLSSLRGAPPRGVVPKSSLAIEFSIPKRSGATVIGERGAPLRRGEGRSNFDPERLTGLICPLGDPRREKARSREQGGEGSRRSAVSLWERPDDEFGH